MLTSYRFKGVELNDGLYYTVPSAGLALDDRNASDEQFVYRTGGAPPLSAGITVKEGVISLNINILAKTPTEFDTRLSALRQLFTTDDPTYYRFERKMPHEAYYRFLEVSVRQFTVVRIERRISVTLNCRERVWQEDAWQTQEWTLFNTAQRDYTLTVNYAGSTPVEPIVEITGLTIGSDGQVPLYYCDTTVYTVTGQQVINTPIRIATNWDTSAHVAAGYMRSDGLDVTVALPDGTRLRRYILGASNARHLWVLPQSWPDLGAELMVSNLPALNGLSSTTIPVILQAGSWERVPKSSKISINNEVLSYTGIFYAEGNSVGMLTGVTRALDGTTQQDLTTADWVAIKWPVALRVGFGYAAAYQGTFYPNDLNGWPVIDYTTSTNDIWQQTNENTVNRAAQNRPFAWYDETWLPEGANEYVEGRVSGSYAAGTAKVALAGSKGYSSRWSIRDRLVLPLYGVGSRRLTAVRCWVTLTAGSGGQYPTIKAELGRTLSNYRPDFDINAQGQAVTYENWRSVTSFTRSSGSGQHDTGLYYIYQGVSAYPITHLFWWLPIAPTNTSPNPPPTNFTLDTVHLYMDYGSGRAPMVQFNSTRKGYGVTGEFPLVLTWQNLADTEIFSVYPLVSVNNTISYNCATYEVTGETIANCSYQNLTWLRLLPGTNQIRVVGVNGIGQVKFKLKWKNRN